MDDLVDTSVWTICFVDEQDHRQLRFECLAKNETCLRKRPFTRVDEKNNAVNHGKSALHLATEIRVAGSVNDVNRDGRTVGVDSGIRHRGVFRENRDSLFLFQVVRVHDAVFEVCVSAERVCLAEHGVDECRLAVVNVGDNRHVSQVGAGGDGHTRILSFFAPVVVVVVPLDLERGRRR